MTTTYTEAQLDLRQQVLLLLFKNFGNGDYSNQSIYQVIFNILLRENQNSLMAHYNDKDYAERSSYDYVHSNCVNYWDDHNQLGYLVGIINNYDYQSCEHGNYQDSLGYAILDQIKELLLKELQLGEIWDFDERKFIQENKLFEVAK